MNKLLARQLERIFGPDQRPRDEATWRAFLARVDGFYDQADRDRLLLERSLELASEELMERNAALRADIEERVTSEEAARHTAALLSATLKELRRSEERARGLIENISDVITITEPDGSYRYVSPSVMRVLGYEAHEFEGRNVMEFIHPDDAPQVAESYARLGRTSHAVQAEFRYRHKDGSWRTLESLRVDARDQPGIGGFLGVSRDVTEKRRLQAEAQAHRESAWRNERLSALGTLVAGVAHEINNPLTYIVGNLEIAQMALDEMPASPQVDEVRAQIQTALTGSERIARITKSLKTVARQAPASGRQTRIQVEGLLRNVFDVTGVGAPDHVRLLLEAGDADVEVLCDPGELHQVFLNLAKNAIEALGEKKGTVRLGVRRTKRHAEVRIADDGPGMDAEHQARLFTPFYTTKAEGTGLGLSIVHSIVTAHGGDILLDSAPGRGSTFVVRLPLAA